MYKYDVIGLNESKSVTIKWKSKGMDAKRKDCKKSGIELESV